MPVVFVPLLVFAGIVALLIAAIRRSLRTQREQKALAAMHPEEPWLWRRDWADRAVRDSSIVAPGFLWFFSILWLAMTTPIAYLMRDRFGKEPIAWILPLFPIAGVLILSAAIYTTLRRRKYGVSICHLEQLPVAIGQTMRGSIEARLTDMPAEGFQLKLTNLRRTVTGSGKNRSVHERVLWQDEQTIRTGAMPNPYGLRLPFSFRVPPDCEPADDRDPNNRVLWRLEIAADVPGIDYQAAFELPVFATGEVDDAWTPEVDPRGWTPPATSGVTFGVAPQGEEIRTSPTQRVADWIPIVLFLVIWFAVLGLVTAVGAPILFVAFFALISLFIVVILGDLFIGHSRVVVGTNQIISHRTWLGIGAKPRTVNATDIESIKPKVGLTSGSRVYHDVVVTLKNGKQVHVLKHIALRRDAELLAAKLRRAVGVK